MLLILVFVLYGGIQAYVAFNLVRAYGLRRRGRWRMAWLAVLMTLFPVLLWWLERCIECHWLVEPLAWLVFVWMGFSFLFFWLGLARDLIAGLAGRSLGGKQGFWLVTLASLGLCVLGIHSAWHVPVQQVVIRSPSLPVGLAGLRIVQLSDVHLGVMMGRARFTGVLDTVRALRPDIIVSTGDLIDAEAHHLDGMSQGLAALHPRFGKYAVTGNHERYAGLDQALDFYARAGFKVLRGVALEVVAGLRLVGVDDPAVVADPAIERRLLVTRPPGHFVLLLKHRPLTLARSQFDLQLSGHTHGGQLFPFGLLVSRMYPRLAGRYSLENGGELYVSRGTGTWGPPMRLLAPPEITLIVLEKG